MNKSLTNFISYLKQFYFFIMILGMLGSQLSFGQSLDEKKAIQEGNAFYLQNDYKKAQAAYEKAIVITPSSLKANYNLGNTLYELKKYSQASTHYQKALQAAQNSSEKALIYHNLGNAFMQEQKYKEAIEAFKNALRNNPSDNQTRYNLALAKKLLSNKANPSDSPPLPQPSAYAQQMKNKADLLAEKGNFDQAFKIMQSALQKDSTVMHYQNYIDKLNEVMILDTIQIK